MGLLDVHRADHLSHTRVGSPYRCASLVLAQSNMHTRTWPQVGVWGGGRFCLGYSIAVWRNTMLSIAWSATEIDTLLECSTIRRTKVPL